MTACEDCLRRTALLARLAPHIERARRERRKLGELLALPDDELVAALAGERRPEVVRAYESFDELAARDRLAEQAMHAVCRHDDGYPQRLLDADDAPAVLHVLGDLGRLRTLVQSDAPAVAIVGARRAGADGLQIARGLGRGLAAAGVTVVSGMALGIDSAAHAGALEVGGPTLAILGGGADVAYPASKRGLHGELVRRQATVSEMPPGFKPFRWCFLRLSGHSGCPPVTVSGGIGAASSCCVVLPQRDRCCAAAFGLTQLQVEHVDEVRVGVALSS